MFSKTGRAGQSLRQQSRFPRLRLIFQSTDDSRLEQNEISENAVGLSFNQCNRKRVIGNRVTQNYIGLRFGSNSDENRFTENIFTRNLHPVETGASDVSGSLLGGRRRRQFLG